jgi:hypothetical protein
MNCSSVDIPVIATGGEGEKVDLKICLAGELNTGLQPSGNRVGHMDQPYILVTLCMVNFEVP